MEKIVVAAIYHPSLFREPELFSFSFFQNTFISTVLHSSTEATQLTVDKLSIYGVQEEPKTVTVGGKNWPFTYLSNQVIGQLVIQARGLQTGQLEHLWTSTPRIAQPAGRKTQPIWSLLHAK